MEFIIMPVQILLGILAFYMAINVIVDIFFTKKGEIYLRRNAHNVDVNNATHNPYISQDGESTRGWGAPNIKNKKTSLKNNSKTTLTGFGPQSRLHRYGWTPSV